MTRSPSFAGRGGPLLALGVAMGVLLLIWWPELSYYHFPQPSLSRTVLEGAREAPSDAVLQELEGFRLFPMEVVSPAQRVRVAEGILQGRLELPGLVPVALGSSFVPQDLDHLPPGLTQLQFAGWEVPDFLLLAYGDTGREEFLIAAREFILEWDRMERGAWVPQGWLWNDHATAARVRVLAMFWRAYRHHLDYQPAVGEVVLQLAARYRYFLASPAHFTFATNHGVMQNLGLLQLEVAFPTLPDGPRHYQIAIARLGQQIPFFLDQQGVIRENSLGYQWFGLEMLGMSFRCMTLLDLAVPEDWAGRYRRGLAFLDQMRRPDGTLPANGDTDGSPKGWVPRPVRIDSAGRVTPLGDPAVVRPTVAQSLHPVAGYWVDWEGLGNWPDQSALRQTVAIWTTPPAPGHKHADEMSVLLWARGISWLTNVGYWPYEDPARDAAEQWQASNAPHLSNESGSSIRTTRLLASARSEALSIVDLERRGPGSLVARRQLLRIRPSLWVVLDEARSTDSAGHTTIWTSAPELTAAPGVDSAGSYYLTSAGGNARLSFTGTPGTRTAAYRGSRNPFAGWSVVGDVPQAAPAVVVTQPAGNAWLVTTLSLEGARVAGPGRAERPTVEWHGAEEWSVALPGEPGTVTVLRSGSRIVVTSGTTADSLALEPGADPAVELGRLRSAFSEVAAQYPAFQPLFSTRIKISLCVLVLFLGQELVFVLIHRLIPRYAMVVRILSFCCWAGVAVWLHFSLLRTWEVLRI